MQFEYEVIEDRVGLESTTFAEILNVYGRYGWELASSYISLTGYKHVLKRALEGIEELKYDVIINHPGDSKLQVVKLIKELTGLGLKESKELADAAPNAVKEGCTKEEAETIRLFLEEAGAEASVEQVENEYELLLVHPGANRHHFCKKMKEEFEKFNYQITLSEAMSIIYDAPTYIDRIVAYSKTELEPIKARLEEAGAYVLITCNST